MTAEARARRNEASIVAPGHATAELATAFASKHTFAEAALTLLAPAIGADRNTLSTGYNYLERAGATSPKVVRVRAKYVVRPLWEQRSSGPPRLVSQWEQAGMEAPATPSQAVVVGQELRASVSRDELRRRIAWAADRDRAVASDCVELTEIEAVIHKAGRFQMDRHPARLARVESRWVAEVPDALLQPGFAGDQHALVDAPMDALMDAHHAGQIYVNVLGVGRRRGLGDDRRRGHAGCEPGRRSCRTRRGRRHRLVTPIRTLVTATEPRRSYRWRN